MFSELSITITKKLSKEEKKQGGIFFTPKSIVKKLVEKVLQVKQEFNFVLEPSCGSGEFLTYLDTILQSDSRLVGIEKNEKIYTEIENLPNTFTHELTLFNQDFLTYNDNEDKPDLIIGNPPYFVCKKEIVPMLYKKYMCGRPNIFCVFILHALSMLKRGGILAFIIPRSFLNSSYYSKIRKYIINKYRIEYILDFEGHNEYIDTDQATVGIIISNSDDIGMNNRYSINIGDDVFFSPRVDDLKNLYSGSTTLKELGLSVKTGTIVWNQHKDKLTTDKSKTMLIYHSNIKNDKISVLEFNNEEKKQYIDFEGISEQVIVVNRGNGNSKYKLTYCLVDLDIPFLLENHLNYIYSLKIKNQELTDLYSRVLNSFKDQRTKLFIDLFIGNGGLSKTELETLLPIF